MRQFVDNGNHGAQDQSLHNTPRCRYLTQRATRKKSLAQMTQKKVFSWVHCGGLSDASLMPVIFTPVQERWRICRLPELIGIMFDCYAIMATLRKRIASDLWLKDFAA